MSPGSRGISSLRNGYWQLATGATQRRFCRVFKRLTCSVLSDFHLGLLAELRSKTKADQGRGERICQHGNREGDLKVLRIAVTSILYLTEGRFLKPLCDDYFRTRHTGA